ncbi:trehalose 6-phosphate synthase [Parafrankia irregularis]|uniref:Trehalose 6-phosphate synthase n=1 Tax=Parafrankia irregularis TaxID=795642 RepID=A0A0S4QQK1_9ACTN|nr:MULTISPECIES: trehalose-6-phosphate synthase [Parafrankia]MBE3204457.1 trehalose-6-phosphate synthase [Parafrankia sp. CH37]CUU57731.1 trehalose 6-phosphate synthase [Parafrankia irregularis]
MPGIGELAAQAGAGSFQADLLVASNRGPVSFAVGDDGLLIPRRGGGGLVSGLAQVVQDAPEDGGELLWVCTALSEADRRAARSAPGGRIDQAGYDTGGASVRMLDLDRVLFDRAYNAVANRTLWFVLHLLHSPSTEPSFGASFRQDWAAYEDYNAAFAEALAEQAAPGACVLVQDYHLTLVPALLRAIRPDVRIAHFSHTPWSPPQYFRMLPDSVAAAILRGMLGADRLGFLAPAWAEAFRECCAEILGATVEGDAISAGGRTVRTSLYPLGVDAAELRDRATRPDVQERVAELRELAGGCRLVVRVDRTELSKNIVRGLDAYRELLRAHPEWHGRVMHLVCAYPSRHDLPEYREYTAAVQRIAAEIEAEFGTESWLPVHLEISDDFPRSLAAMSLADVLVVNPIRDGMNLVAKEGMVVSTENAVLILSREAGACSQMSADALVVNPFDVTATAEAMHTALTMDPAQRCARTGRLAAIAAQLPPRAWFRAQLDEIAG